MSDTVNTVKKETLYVAAFSFFGSVLIEAVFVIIGRWDPTVLYGNLLSFAVGVLNFYLLGRTIEKAVTLAEDEMRRTVRISHTLRFLLLIAAAALGAWLPCFHTVTAILPLFFPRIAIALRTRHVEKE